MATPTTKQGNGWRLDWQDRQLMELAKRATGETLERCAAVVERRVKDNLRKIQVTGKTGESVWSGKFQTRDGVAGGFVGITSLWHIIEYGTYRSKPQPFFRPAVESSRGEMAAILKGMKV